VTLGTMLTVRAGTVENKGTWKTLPRKFATQ